MGAYDDRPYEVGKGKPPKQHRWAKGQSGNPRGPRRRAKEDDASMTELLASAINEKVSITISGEDRRVTKKTVILMQLVNDAASGSPRTRLSAIKLLNELNAFNLLGNDGLGDAKDQEVRVQAVVEELRDFAIKEIETNEAFAHLRGYNGT